MRTLLLAASILLAACNTRFTGDPIVPQGPSTCVQVCRAWNMELAGMVYMGEHYTDGCICAVPGQAAVGIHAAAGAAAASAAVHESGEQDDDNAAAASASQPY